MYFTPLIRLLRHCIACVQTCITPCITNILVCYCCYCCCCYFIVCYVFFFLLVSNEIISKKPCCCCARVNKLNMLEQKKKRAHTNFMQFFESKKKINGIIPCSLYMYTLHTVRTEHKIEQNTLVLCW